MLRSPSSEIAQFLHQFIAFAKIAYFVTWLDVGFCMRTSTRQWYHMIKMQVAFRANMLTAYVTHRTILLEKLGIVDRFRNSRFLSRSTSRRTSIIHLWIALIFSFASSPFSFYVSYVPCWSIHFRSFVNIFIISLAIFFNLPIITFFAIPSIAIFFISIWIEIINAFFCIATCTQLRQDNEWALNIRQLMPVQSYVFILIGTFTAFCSMSQSSLRLFIESIKRFDCMALSADLRGVFRRIANGFSVLVVQADLTINSISLFVISHANFVVFRERFLNFARWASFSSGIHIIPTPLVSTLFWMLPGSQGYFCSHPMISQTLDNTSIIPFFSSCENVVVGRIA